MIRNFSDSIFWVEVDKIKPNPYQPRKEFDEASLRALSDSIRQYGVLQPLVVTRKEVEKVDGGIAVEYELIAGERRLRASKLAGLREVPAVIRTGEQTDEMKLELAIIENLQREDLNPIDRALAFKKLTAEFNYSHAEVAKKVGKSREYVTNTLRLLNLSEDLQNAVREGKITEGHTRPLLMLADRPDEQKTLFQEIMLKRLSVREAESISRRIAVDKARTNHVDPELVEIEGELSTKLGTRVHIDKRQGGASGRVVIDFFSVDDLKSLIAKIDAEIAKSPISNLVLNEQDKQDALSAPEIGSEEELAMINDVPKVEEDENSDDLYSVSNFSV